MENLRKPSEVILSKGRNLEEVLELHMKWLNDEEGGKRADLSCEDLSYVDLKGAILSYAKLKGVNLESTNLKGVNLKGVDLEGVDLEGVDLSYSNLINVDLENCKFYSTNLYKCKGDFVSVGNIGSRNDTTHYFYKQNRVICERFNGTMEEFENKVKKFYDKDDKEYKQYMIAIDVLKRLAEIELEMR